MKESFWGWSILLLIFFQPSWSKPFGSKSNKSKYPKSSSQSNNHRGGNGGDDDGNNNNNNNSGSSKDPLDLVRASCQEQWYDCWNVVTVQDVYSEISRQTSPSSLDLSKATILFRGKLLNDPATILRDQGISSGDTLLVVLEGQVGIREMFALLLEMLSKEDGMQLARLFKYWRNLHESDEGPLQLPEMGSTTSQQISQNLRSAVDLGYHRLRSWWEQPLLRLALQNPNMEAYRLILNRHLPPKVRSELSPHAREVLSNPQVFQQVCQKWTKSILKFGDVFMDGLLDIVLDVVQGASRSQQSKHFHDSSSLSSQFRKGNGQDPSKAPDGYEPSMEDPSMANQMLFELSESEED